jgi:hypothetical protein
MQVIYRRRQRHCRDTARVKTHLDIAANRRMVDRPITNRPQAASLPHNASES